MLEALRGAHDAAEISAAVDLEFVRGICRRDKANHFAISVPTRATGALASARAADALGTRRARAYGIYPHLAIANHR